MKSAVYVSDALRRYPDVYLGIITACRQSGIKQGIVDKTQNIWCRDFMPVQVNNHFVKFRYKNGLTDHDFKCYPQLKVTDECYPWLLDRMRYSDIVLDGGNCVNGGNKFYVTDIIFKHNPRYRKITLLSKLEKVLESEVILIPVEPYDDLGHSDGILKPISDNEVFINDYRVMNRTPYEEKVYRNYHSKLVGCLTHHKINCIPFPYAYHRQPKMREADFRKKYPMADDFNPGIGYYINFLMVDSMIILPQFGIEEDAKAERFVKQWFPHSNVFPIDCSDLAMEGGMINCVTWEYRDGNESHGTKSGRNNVKLFVCR